MRNLIAVAHFIGIAALASLVPFLSSCSPQTGVLGGGAGGAAPQESTGGRGGEEGSAAGSGGSGIVVHMDASLSGSGGAIAVATTPTIDANCGFQTSETKRVPVDVLLIFDCSVSMIPIWDSFRAAVMQAISATKDIRWGLKLYPSPGLLPVCGVENGVEVEISATSSAAIEAQLTKTKPAGLTPTGKAIQTAATYLAGVGDQSDKAILLATDGEPNCDSDVPATVKAIAAAKSAGFPVYVVGVGNSVGNLDNFAQAGGTGKYYPAPSIQDLTNVLQAISKVVVSCTFALTSVPPDPDNIAVYLDKNLVPKDGSNGWTFDPAAPSVTLTGSYCSKVTTSSASTVQVLFGCPGYVAPPVLIFGAQRDHDGPRDLSPSSRRP